jgi:predicted amidohydrolase YtcJ
VNGRIYPPGGRGPFAEAVAVQRGRILALGSSDEMRRLAGTKVTVLDARRGSVLPGFNDAHVHFISGGLGLEQADLSEAGTLAEVETRIRAYAAAHAGQAWILGGGWHYTAFPGGLPTRQQLDALVADRPAFLDCYDGHTGWANSKALALAGITKSTPDPAGGAIVRDPKTGEPTGALKETAQRLLAKVLPDPTRDDRARALKAAVAEANRFGVTSVQNAGVDPDDLDLYDELRRGGGLTVRVYAALPVSAPFSDADADHLDPIRARYRDDPVLKVGGAKLFVDGVIESHTAVMLEPYADDPGRGTPRLSAAELDRIVALLDRRGWQVWMHAIGDGAVRMALDACERASAANPAPARGRRHRIEHIETVAPADIPRFGRLGVIASQQPFHGNPSTNAVWTAAIGPERASRGWAFRSIADAGGGSRSAATGRW